MDAVEVRDMTPEEIVEVFKVDIETARFMLTLERKEVESVEVGRGENLEEIVTVIRN